LRARGDCRVGNPKLWGSRLGVSAGDPFSVDINGALLVDLSTGKLSLMETRARPDKVPQWQTLNAERVVWWWAPGDELSSFSAIDGTDFKFFVSATYQGPVLGLRTPVGFPSGFLYEALLALEGGAAQRTVFLSDGLDPGAELVPTEPGFDYAQAEYVHSHIAWLRGWNGSTTTGYESVELWAAPWSAGKLGTPTRVGVLDTVVYEDRLGMSPETAGAYGHYLAPFGDGDTFGRAEVWNIAKGTRQRNDLPPSATALGPSGVTRTHAYVVARMPALGHPLETRLLRYAHE